MPTYAGPSWSEGRLQGTRFIRVERGRVVDEGDGEPKGARPGVLLHGLHNYHTHVGDGFLQGRQLPRSLPALVKPRTGFKDRMLAKANRATVARGMRAALIAHDEAGTRSVLDFREQGVAGVALLREVAAGLPGGPLVRALGRPTRQPADSDELADLLESGDGLGIPSIVDVDADVTDEAARACRRARRPFTLHASEQRRDPIEDVLAFEPQLLVHLCAATAADFRAIAKTDVPVAVCPSSNSFFGLRSPVAALHKARIPFFFGTDNAMLGHYDLAAEVARARKWAPRVPDDVFLRALTTPVEKAIKRTQTVPAPAGLPDRVVVVPRRRSRVDWGSRPVVATR